MSIVESVHACTTSSSTSDQADHSILALSFRFTPRTAIPDVRYKFVCCRGVCNTLLQFGTERNFMRRDRAILAGRHSLHLHHCNDDIRNYVTVDTTRWSLSMLVAGMRVGWMTSYQLSQL